MRFRLESIFVSWAVAFVSPFSAIAAVPFPLNDPMPTSETRSYAAWSRDSDFLFGKMKLSNKYASFSRLQGHMDLKLWGVEPYKQDDLLSGAQIFHIENAKDFFQMNKGLNGFCMSQPNWLVISKVKHTYPYAVPEEVVIFLLTVDDIFQLNWNKHDCSEDTYLLEPFKEYPHFPGWDEFLRRIDPI